MKQARTLSLVIVITFLFLWTNSATAQSIFSTNANASSLGNSYYQVTANNSHKKGSVWNNEPIDLTQPFDLSYQFYFGTIDTGADGMSFTIQNYSAGLNTIGDDGRNMGYSYASGTPISPALNVEFDTYDNGISYGDIPQDHLAIFRDGNQTVPLAAPIFVVSSGTNIEDGLWHLVEFVWDPSTITLEIYFDCDLREVFVYDVLNSIFGGNPSAYVGITGGTGLLKNLQKFREIYHDAGTDTSICFGNSMTINASSDVDSLKWTPSTGLSCDTCENPVASPQSTTTYYLSGEVSCKSFLDSVTITVLPLSSLLMNVAICQGESWYAGGANQTTSGTYYDTLNNALGCDSVVTTALVVHANTSSSYSASICQGQSFFCGGGFQTQSGTYTDTLNNSFGCDSVITTHLIVNLNSTFNQNIQICEGQSFYCGGANQTQSGIYLDHYTNALGCDSAVTTNLSVIPFLSTSQNISICQGQTFYCGGAMQSQSGVYLDSLISVSGCDSIVTTNLAVLSNSSFSVSVSICQGQTYFCGGALQTQSGVYIDTLSNNLGCDSALTTHLSVLANSFFAQNISICNGQSFYCGGANQTQSGIYFDTLQNSVGCDSIVTTNLNLLSNSAFNQSISICEGDSILAGGIFQTQSGSYLDHYVNYLGCDSLVTTNLVVHAISITQVNALICEGDSFYAGGANQTQSGVYVDSLTSSSGCDSIVTTNLSVQSATVTDVYPEICEGEEYFAGGSWQTASGVFVDSLSSSIGCDSTVITHLVVNPMPLVNLGNDTTLCEGNFISLNAGAGFQSYLWQDNSTLPFITAKEFGSYWVMITNSFGCSSSDTLKIKDVYPLPDNFLVHDTLICGNIPLDIEVPGFENYLWSDGDTASFNVFTQEGSYWLKVTDDHGCNATDTTTITNACDDDFLMPNAFTPNDDGLNDVLLPIMIHPVTDYNLKIFNRWGIMIFESDDPATGWDGFDQGVRGEMGVYVWEMEYTLESGERKSAKGNVSLLR